MQDDAICTSAGDGAMFQMFQSKPDIKKDYRGAVAETSFLLFATKNFHLIL
jgi:hypothetical protein